LIAEQIDMLALNWMVLQWTNSPLVLGIFTFFRLIPLLLLQFVGGMLADRVDRRRLLIGLQTGMMLLTFALAIAVVMGVKNLYLLVAIVLVRSCLMALETPIWHTYLPNLVEREAVTSAVAVFSTSANLARIVGPALGGLFIAAWGVESIFFISAVGYLFIITTLYFSSQRDEYTASTKKKPKAGMGEAITYIRSEPTLLQVLLLGIFTMIFGFCYTSMMPVFAQDLLHVGAEGLGYLMSAAAAGAILGSMWLAGTKEGSHGRAMIVSGILFGLGFVGLAYVHDLVPALMLMFLIGLFGQTFRTANRVIFQHRVPDHLRGRVMSIVLSDRGFIPLGSMLIGFLAEGISPTSALIVMGVVCALAAFTSLIASREILKM
jgi:MFS family permease